MATPVISLEQASKTVAEEVRKRNLKIVEQVPQMIAELAKKNQFFIFNVGPRPWSRSLGSLGSYYVQPCPEGAKHSEPLVIDGVILERVPTEMNKMANRYENGIDVANDVLFIGRGYDPMLSGTRWGLFISETRKPSEEQLKAARTALRLTQQKLVDEADVLNQQNKRHEITDQHREAAKALAVNKPWLAEEAKELEKCPACGRLTDVEGIRCQHDACRAIFDWERARIYYPQEYLAYQQANAVATPKK